MKRKELEHFLLGSYTIGFIMGSWLYVINPTLNLRFSFENIFCIIVVLPILYWVYRYSGMVFNDQSIKMKLIYSLVLILGLGFGIFFSELLLS